MVDLLVAGDPGRHYLDVGSRRLLICANSGGSNGNRLQACKWNQIEHRMFSFISLNWRGQLLMSYETVVNLISRTTTRTLPRRSGR